MSAGMGTRTADEPSRLLEDHIVVITGGGRGIGREIAIACARGGADVVVAGRSADLMEQTAARVQDVGRQALVVGADLTDPEAPTVLARETLKRFGRCDVLVNNSGVGGPITPLWEIELKDWEETFAVNVTGVFLCCRAFLPPMIERGSGCIVNIGSVTGKRPLANRSSYAASKLALLGLTRTLATEVGPHGIRANLVSPGPVEGERIEAAIGMQAEVIGTSPERMREQIRAQSPMGRFVTAEEVAAAVVFLASNSASGITGADLNVSSGFVMY